jgi:hypothetical protein
MFFKKKFTSFCSMYENNEREDKNIKTSHKFMHGGKSWRFCTLEIEHDFPISYPMINLG